MNGTSTTTTGVNSLLFKSVEYYLSSSITSHIRLQLDTLLINNGATRCPSRSSPRLTHYITNSLDFESITATVELVLPAWVTRSYDLQTLQSPRFYSPDPALFFSGLVFATSELPPTDSHQIQLGVTTWGGQFRRELTREVTHLFVIAERGNKYQAALKFGQELGMQIVLPHWFDDCLKCGTLVPTHIFRFPSPPLLSLLSSSSTSESPSGPSSTSTLALAPAPTTALQALQGKPFEERLAEYLKLHPNLSRPPPPPPAAAARPSASGSGEGQGDKDKDKGAMATTATQRILGDEATHRGLCDSGAYLASYSAAAASSVVPGVGARSTSRLGTGTGTRSGSGSESPFPLPSTSASATGPGQGLFHDQFIYLASDLNLRPGLEAALRNRILEGGGECWGWSMGIGLGGGGVGVGGGAQGQRRDAFERRREAQKILLDKATIVVVRAREGWEFWHAYSAPGKTLCTLPYLYHCLSTASLPSPLQRLLHYPLPSGPGGSGMPEFRGKVITISNYAGPARDYVRALIEATGARFEGAMSKGTSYVVTASEYGNKVLHARSWSIPLVSHLWLEACLLEWRFLDPATSSSFLADASTTTNFTTILGNTPVRRDAVERWAMREEQVIARREGLRELPEQEEDEEEVAGEEEVMAEAAEPRFEKETATTTRKAKEEKKDPSPPRPPPRLPPTTAPVPVAPAAPAPEPMEQDAAAVEEEPEEEEDEEQPIRSPPKRKMATTSHRIPSDDEEGGEDDEAGNEKQKREEKEKGEEKEKEPPSKKLKVRKAVSVPKGVEVGDSPKDKDKSKSKSKSKSAAQAKGKKPKGKGREKSSSSSSSGTAEEDEEEQSRLAAKAKAAPASMRKAPSSSAARHSAAAAAAAGKSTPQNVASKGKGKSKSKGKKRSRSDSDGSQSHSTSSSSSSSSSDESPPPSAKAFGKTFGLVDPANVIPSRSGRAAAGRAAALLKEQMPDANQFAKELKSSGKKPTSGGGAGGGGVGGKRPRGGAGARSEDEQDRGSESEDEEEEKLVAKARGRGKPPAATAMAKKLAKRRKSSDTAAAAEDVDAGGRRPEKDDDEEEEEGDEEDVEPVVVVQKKRKAPATTTTTTTKKGRAAQLQATGTETTQEGGAVSSFDNPPKGKSAFNQQKRKAVIMSTGLGLDTKSAEIKAMKSLGASYTDSSAATVTHLVVKAISRTEKFLSCIGHTPFIVTKAWIDASIAAGRLVEESPYLLKDKSKEKEINDTLVDILERASRKKLFDKVTIYVTKSVSPDASTMQRILQSGNAVVVTTKLTSTMQQNIIRTWKEDVATHETETPRLRVISCPADRAQWEPLAAKGVPIFSVEAVFHSVMHQNFDGFVKANRIDQQL